MEIKKGQIWEVKDNPDGLLPEFVVIESLGHDGMVCVKCDVVGMFDVLTLSTDNLKECYTLVASPKPNIEKGQIWVTSVSGLPPELEILDAGAEYRSRFRVEFNVACVKATFQSSNTVTRCIEEKTIRESYKLKENKMEENVKLKDMPTDQWNEIVSTWLDDPSKIEFRNFLGVFKSLADNSSLDRNSVYRIKPKKLLDIPWHLVKKQFKFAFMDSDGSVFVSPTKPTESSVGGWYIPHTVKSISHVLNIDTVGVHWKTSVTSRPCE